MFGDKHLVEEYNLKFSNLSKSDMSSKMVVCPPYPLIPFLENQFALGAQNCHEELEGAYTGEVSPRLLKEIGCSHVLLGHSERRKYYDETSAVVQEKALRAHNQQLIPIVCVGSLSRDTKIIKEDLEKQIKGLPPSSILAYEPIWSIGTDQVPSVDHIQDIVVWLRSMGFVNVVYGGSVNTKNAHDIKAVCDGLLVGRLSLDVDALKTVLSCHE